MNLFPIIHLRGIPFKKDVSKVKLILIMLISKDKDYKNI